MAEQLVRRRHGQRGETLVESMLAVVIISAIVLGTYAGLSVAISAGTRHDSSARGETLARSAAEWVQSPDTSYVARAGCPGGGNYSLPSFGTEQPGYSVAVTKIEFWTNPPPSTTTPLPTSATVSFGEACPSTDQGLQRITVSATRAGAATQTLTVVKRRP